MAQMRKMKTKKALKRLNRVEALLSKIIDQIPGGKARLGELLDSAKVAVVRAKKTVNSQLKKRPVRAKTARRGRLTPEGRKKISLAAKKRWAVARRKGMNPVTGLPLSKTA
jgi:hypothetical protein